jgi:formylglycine-generating enzyme required for sulfatase activity
MQAANLVDWQGEPDHPEFTKLLHGIESIHGFPKRKAKAKLVVPTKAMPKRSPAPPSTIQTAPESMLTNSIGMNFVLVPAGSFMMGSGMSPKEIVDRFGGGEEWFKPEKPHHSVKILKPFYLQTTPVTQGQWQRVMGNNPSYFEDCGGDCPVEQVSWKEAQQFIEKLNKGEKMKEYRLPSEAEWEYACRAGSETEFFFGDDAKRLGEFAWYSENSESKTHPVGKKKANGWGLYDMHGNVWEWVEDDWHDNYSGAPNDGSAWIDKPRGLGRVVRGGSWLYDAQVCRSARRFNAAPGARNDTVGFRLSRSVALGS